ncbi:hypothetical protein AB0D13_32700 [Streptomyces sp. NPDC048430]|uniref:hypothetical protein n=1 Tax=Streptomyces sp. NPDC048430 TaxID=3155388 RepID=UPI00344A454A
MNRGRSGGRATGSGGWVGAPGFRGGATGPVTAAGGQWLFTGRDGRMTAYGTTADGLVRWTEPVRSGGSWAGPEPIEVPRRTGGVAMARSREGYVHFAVLQGDGGRADRVAVATQFQTGLALSGWHDLGLPAAQGGAPDDILVHGPLIAVNPAIGSVHVLVSMRQGGVFRRSRKPEGNWGGWKPVTDRAYVSEPWVVMTEGGPLEILACGPDGADYWVGTSNGRFELADRIDSPIVAGTVTAHETGPKRATYFWRYPGDGSLVAWRRGQQGNGAGLMSLGGAGGSGAPSVTRALVGGYDCTVLAQTGVDGTIEVTAYVTENEGYGMWWARIEGAGGDSPQVAVDGAGRIVVAALDKTGALLVARQDRQQEGLAFGPFSRAD